MKITLNDEHEMELPANTHKVIHVASGKHKLQVVADGATIFDGVKQVEASSWVGKTYTYLFNPDFTNRYATYNVQYGEGLSGMMEDAVRKYGESKTGQKADELNLQFNKLRKETAAMPMSPWFEIPSGVDYYFSEPPDEVYTRNMTEMRTVIVRATKEDHSIILAAKDNVSPTVEEFDALYDAVDQLWYYPTRPTSVETEDEEAVY
jgi:hypothetical protein